MHDVREGEVSEELRGFAVRRGGVAERPFAELVSEGAVPGLAARDGVEQPKLHAVLLTHVLDAHLPGAQKVARLFPDLYELLAGEDARARLSAVDAHEVAAAVGV